MRVFAIPLRTRFRGIEVREGVLLQGEAGWGEFSPFLEYDDPVAAPWLACAREAATARCATATKFGPGLTSPTTKTAKTVATAPQSTASASVMPRSSLRP